MKNRRKPPVQVIGWIIGGIFAAGAFALLFGFIVVWLWNGLMPKLFGLSEIQYWQAVGLMILAKLFFGGGHHPGSHSPRSRKRWKKWNHEHYRMGPEDWRHFSEYWKSEGRDRFHEYRREKYPDESANRDQDLGPDGGDQA